MGAAPNQPLSFCAVQACFQEHRTISKTGFTRTTVVELFNPIMLAVPWRTAGVCNWGGGAAPHPNSPAFHFTPADLFSRTWYHQPELFQKSIMQADGGLHPAQLSHFANLCKIASSIILPAKTEPIWTLSEPVIKKIYDEPG